MEELIPMNIVVADRSYRIKLKASDEEVVRKTLKIINNKIVEFKTTFAGKDMQDYIAMVVVWYATQTQANQGTAMEMDAIKQALLAIDKGIKGQ